MSDTRVTDPQRIRALAHPLRLRLLDVLGDGPATATACAAATGESVASCSFHLRMLAKYGFVERDPQRGRERPWRLLDRGFDVRPVDGDDESLRAVEAIAQIALEHHVEAARRFLAAIPQESPAWVQAATLSSSSAAWATADELAEVSRELQGVLDRFAGRRDDMTTRPPGARPIRVVATAFVDLDREARAAARP